MNATKAIAIISGMLTYTATYAQADKQLFYIGSLNSGPEAGITLGRLDLASGNVAILGRAAQLSGPGYLSLSPKKDFLYTYTDKGIAKSFKVGQDGALTEINELPINGAGPAHISMDPAGKMVFVANYGDGSFVGFKIGEGGELASEAYHEKYSGQGPNKNRQDKAHAHAAVVSPNGKNVYVADLGTDAIMNYTLDADLGKLSPNAEQKAYMEKPGSGPRHMVISRDGKYLYVLNELNATVSVLGIDHSGVLEHLATYETVPADAKEGNTSAAIRLHPSGKFLFVSNRGYNAITGFRISDGGKLEKLAGEAKEGIDTPRDFNIDPSGKFLISANQRANNLTVYSIDSNTGALKLLGKADGIQMPSDVDFL